MAEILIEHPNHGRIHVYTAAALAQYTEMGWTLISIDGVAPQGVTPEPEAPAEPQETPRQRGRPRKDNR